MKLPILHLCLLLPSLLASAAPGANDSRNFARCQNENWSATWSTALHQPDLQVPGLSNQGFQNQTLRQIVHVSIGGRKVRVRFSTFSAGGLAIGAAHVALSAGGPAIVPSTDRTLTFGGKPTITVPPGTPVLSDPVDLNVPELADLAITLFLPGATGPATWHFDARETPYVSPSGNFAASATLPLDLTTPALPSFFWISAVEVMTPRPYGVVAALGDSVADGAGSTVDANHRWPDVLAGRLMSQPSHRWMGVLNEGLDGNRILHDGVGPNALSRLERDVLSQTGLTHVILTIGLNDITAGWPGGSNPDQEVTVDQMVQAYRQFIERAHAKKVRILGATLSPMKGFVIPGTPFPAYSPQNEVKRQQVNQWIRSSGEFDGVIDFDRVLRDPKAPDQLRADLDSGDHVHPTDEGYAAMARAIDLNLLRNDDL